MWDPNKKLESSSRAEINTNYEEMKKRFPHIVFKKDRRSQEDNSMEIMNELIKPFFDELNIELTKEQYSKLHDLYLASSKFLVYARRDWALEQNRLNNNEN